MKSTATLQRRAPMSRGTAQLARGAGFKPAEPKPAAGPKQKKCACCRMPFQPSSPRVKVCGLACAVTYGQAVTAKQKAKEQRERRTAAKEERRKDGERREHLKTYPDLVKEAQTAFNAFIRLRDQLAGHACISSGRPLDWSGNAVDAGHYRSVGSAPHLRFNEDNVHAQSKHDNQYKSGNAVDYRLGLIARIGLERVEALEANNTAAKWTHDELRAIKAEYQRRVREMKKEAACAI